MKAKTMHYNNSRFMTRQLGKSIMTRSKLRNRLDKIHTSENWANL